MALTHHPDEGGSTFLRSVERFLPDYTAQLPRRQSSSCIILLYTIRKKERSLETWKERKVSRRQK
jgi:hypothetical protein